MRFTPLALAALLLGAMTGGASAVITNEQYAELRKSCGSDYTRFCADIDPGSPAIAQCFQRNFSKVSQRCKDSISKNVK